MKCYLCAKNPVEYLFTNNGYPIYRCVHCGLGWAVLRKLYESFVREYYDTGYFEGETKRCAYDNYEKDYRFMKKNFLKVLEGVRNYVQAGSLLDIGCATGLFLQLARSKGFMPFGIEPSSYAARCARERFGDHIQEATLSEAHFARGKFSVITMLDVFEHLNDPHEALRKCRTWLNEKGLLVIATNDFDSIWAKLNGRKWHFLIPPQHLFFFTEKTVRRILAENGFSVEKMVRPGKWITLGYGLHLAYSIQGNRLAGFLHKFFKPMGLLSLPLYINFFDHMVVYARKQP